jgi:mannose-1-phosphate guanylyltransferase
VQAKFSKHAVILAGGRGTRFWPRSRTGTPKQLLNILGNKTMLQQTVARLAPVLPVKNFWVVTHQQQAAAVRRNVPRIPAGQILAEPAGRNTAAAIGLAAVHIHKAARGADTLMAVFPADHYIGKTPEYLRIVRAAWDAAAQGPYLVTLGIHATRAETGYGYIESAEPVCVARGEQFFRVARFVEKPDAATAQQYCASGKHLWNAGMFFWRVSTFLRCLEAFLPKTYAALQEIAAAIGTRRYAARLRKLYPRLENISVDYAVMERATRPPPPGQAAPATVLTVPANAGWSDMGSWSAVYDLLAKSPGGNVSAGPHAAMEATGNFFWSPGKFVGAIGVKDLVVVETHDALLICPRERAQDVGKLVKWLEEKKQRKLL